MDNNPFQVLFSVAVEHSSNDLDELDAAMDGSGMGRFDKIEDGRLYLTFEGSDLLELIREYFDTEWNLEWKMDLRVHGMHQLDYPTDAQAFRRLGKKVKTQITLTD